MQLTANGLLREEFVKQQQQITTLVSGMGSVQARRRDAWVSPKTHLLFRFTSVQRAQYGCASRTADQRD